MKKTRIGIPNQRLKAERELRGWSQKYVAEQIGADHYYLSRWERGTISPSPYYRQKLCVLFGKNAQELGLLQQASIAPVQDRFSSDEHGAVSTSERSVGSQQPQQTVWDLPRPRPMWKMPTPLTSLIGREQLVQDICTVLSRPAIRFLTLLGPGGVGKSRVAIQVANQLRHAFADGVCFVPLAQISDPNMVIPAIAQGLGIQEQPERSTFEQVNGWLLEKQFLLLLDNFEQVLTAVPLIEEVYAACPQLKVLVTSRAVLHVQGEQEFPVPPLALPDLRNFSDDWMLSTSAAVTLFVQRVQASLPTFQLTQTNVQAIGEICVLLDGLPLTLELAAARIKLLPPYALLARLSQRLQVLGSGAITLPERQQTLRNTLNWSYDLLEARERRIFRRLCIFVGGCDLSAVGAICLDAEEQETEVLNTVASLIDKSLVRQEDQEGEEPRLALLETVREYGLECLWDNGEDEVMHRAHAAYYLAMAKRIEPHLRGGGEQLKWLTKLNRDQENFRAALRWLVECEETEHALQLCAALWWYWFMRAYYKEALHWLEAALALPGNGKPSSARACVLAATGVINGALGPLEKAHAFIEESIALYKELKDRRGASHALQFLAWIYLEQGDFPTARSFIEQGLNDCRALGDTWNVALGLNDLARMMWAKGDGEAARRLWEECIALCREIGETWALARTLFVLARMVLTQGDYVRAMLLLQESTAIARDFGDMATLSGTLVLMAEIVRREDEAHATQLLQEGLTIAREIGVQGDLSFFHYLIGDMARVQGNISQANEHFRESLMLAPKGTDMIAVVGRCLLGLAKIARTERRFQEGVRLLSAGEQRLHVNVDLHPDERIEYEHVLTEMRVQLGEKAFTVAWTEGHSMTLEQTFALQESRLS